MARCTFAECVTRTATAQTVSCPTCQAPPRAPCTFKGRRKPHPHITRVVFSGWSRT